MPALLPRLVAQAIEVVVLALIVLGSDEEAARAGYRVLDDIAQLRLHHADDAVDRAPRAAFSASRNGLNSARRTWMASNAAQVTNQSNGVKLRRKLSLAVSGKSDHTAAAKPNMVGSALMSIPTGFMGWLSSVHGLPSSVPGSPRL